MWKGRVKDLLVSVVFLLFLGYLETRGSFIPRSTVVARKAASISWLAISGELVTIRILIVSSRLLIAGWLRVSTALLTDDVSVHDLQPFQVV